jgi:TPR repeat protein
MRFFIACAFLLLTGVASYSYSQVDRLEAGLAAYDRGQYATAIRAWMRAAEEGSAEAQNNVGHMYEEGLGVPQNYLLAMNWYRQAAEGGLPEGQHNMGLLYYHGYGVAENLLESVRWFRMAAEQEFPESEYMLGMAYEQGKGVALDYALAREYLLRSAKRNYPSAQLMYAFMLQAGEGGESDSYNGYLWGKIALENGVEDAVNITSIASIPLSQQQIDQADALAKLCLEEGFDVCME